MIAKPSNLRPGTEGPGLAAQVELLVSGDDDLLDLSTFEGVAIVTPAEALRRVEAQK